jgi:hypothetical protein
MNEREKTDELLRQMGEVHRRHEASHDENALLMRALERKPRRPVWALAGWLVAALVVVGLVLKPLLPAMGGKAIAEYTVNGVKVRMRHSDEEFWRGTYYQCSWEGKEYYIAQQPDLHPEEPLAAEVPIDDITCLLYPTDTPLAEPNLSEAAKYKPHLDTVQSVSSQMDKAKLWPADLWAIRPFVRKLSRGEFRMVYTGPVDYGFVHASNRYCGDQVGHWLHGFGMEGVRDNPAMDTLTIRLYVWPDNFTLRTLANPELFLSGDGGGYDAYQAARCWGEGVRDSLLRVKHYLPKYLELLPLLGDSIPPEYTRSLQQTVDQIVTSEPRALYHADLDMLDNRMEPWRPAEQDQAERGRLDQAFAGLVPEFSIESNGVKVFRQTPQEVLSIARDGLEIRFWPPRPQLHFAEGIITRNGERLSTRVFVLSEGRLPYLRCRLSPEDESLLNELASMARDALQIPAGEWPSEGFPRAIVDNWLGALVDRQFALQESLGRTLLMGLIEREGGSAALVIDFGERASMGERTSMDLNLRLEPDAWQLLNTATGYLVSMSGGKLSAIRAADAAPEALTAEHRRQLDTALEIVGASPEGVPSAVQTGIKLFREFLEHPEVAQAEVVEELPELPWAGMVVLDRGNQVSLGVAHLEEKS